MTRQLFDETIGTMPPAAIDVTAIIRRENRARRLRRITAGGACALAVVAALIGINLVIARPAAPPSPHPAAPTSTASPSIAPGFKLDFDTKAATDATLARLNDELDRALHTFAPGASWVFMPHYVGDPATYVDKPDTPGPVAPPLFIADRPSGGKQAYVSGALASGANRGSIYVRIWYPLCHSSEETAQTGPRFTRCTADPVCGRAAYCSTGVTPGGHAYTISEDTAEYTGPGLNYQAIVKLANGMSLQVMVDNSYGYDQLATFTELPPMSRDQTLAVATAMADLIRY